MLQQHKRLAGCFVGCQQVVAYLLVNALGQFIACAKDDPAVLVILVDRQGNTSQRQQ